MKSGLVRNLSTRPVLDAWGDTDFRYDSKAQRYRVGQGAGRGQFISKTAYLATIRASIVSRSEELIALADRLADGDINLPQFQAQAATLLKKIHVAQAIIGADGHENLSAEDWLNVGRLLKRQVSGGIDPDTGKRYGLKYLAQEIQAGEVSRARLRQRLKLYSESGKKAYWGARIQKSKRRYGFRVLGDAEHCPECLAYAAEPPKAVEDLVMPTERCSCMNQCKCSIRLFETLEEAIAAKMGQ